MASVFVWMALLECRRSCEVAVLVFLTFWKYVILDYLLNLEDRMSYEPQRLLCYQCFASTCQGLCSLRCGKVHSRTSTFTRTFFHACSKTTLVHVKVLMMAVEFLRDDRNAQPGA
jgi:hypothetical protein